MLRVLDPHSNFFDPKQYSALQEEQRGRYYGVGMQVGPRNNKVIVIAPFAGAPAYRAGIRPGDIIVSVDGKATDNMTTSDVADLLKGPKVPTVHIGILREGNAKPLDFTVVRDEIPRYSVDLHFLIRPGIGYLHISGFQETTEAETTAALDEMGDLKGLILDLRNNPGGLLSEGVGVADKFLKKGQVIRQPSRPQLTGEGLSRRPRQHQGLPHRRAREPRYGLGGRDRLGRNPGP